MMARQTAVLRRAAWRDTRGRTNRMSGHRPFAKLTKNFTEERWQSVATKCTKQREVSLFISPSGKERKPKMSVSSVLSYLRKTRFASPSRTFQFQRAPEYPADPLDVPARLREFRAMEDGWYDGEGEAPPWKGLDWLANKFRARYPDDIPLPYTYPTPKGGIEMEWSIGEHSVILEVDLSTRQGDYLGFDDKSDVENTRTLDLDSGDGWTWMIDNIRQLTERPK